MAKLATASFLVTLAVLSALLLTNVSADAAQAPLSFSPGYSIIQQPVEQESPNFFYNNCVLDPRQPICDPLTWVYNPTGCLGGIQSPPSSCQGIDIAGYTWDVDDTASSTAFGDLAGGQTISGQIRVILDPNFNYGNDPPVIYARVTSKSSKLRAVLENDLGIISALDPVKVGNDYSYCINRYDFLPLDQYVEIPESNGGIGRKTIYSFTITNMSKGNTKVAAVLQSGESGRFANICP